MELAYCKKPQPMGPGYGEPRSSHPSPKGLSAVIKGYSESIRIYEIPGIPGAVYWEMVEA